MGSGLAGLHREACSRLSCLLSLGPSCPGRGGACRVGKAPVSRSLIQSESCAWYTRGRLSRRAGTGGEEGADVRPARPC